MLVKYTRPPKSLLFVQKTALDGRFNVYQMFFGLINIIIYKSRSIIFVNYEYGKTIMMYFVGKYENISNNTTSKKLGK